MKKNITLILLIFSILAQTTNSQTISLGDEISTDTISELKGHLKVLADQSNNAFFDLHCHSILEVINSKKILTKKDSVLLKELYVEFTDNSLDADPVKIETYLKRKRNLIIAWISPTDSTVSFSWLKLPKNWKPKKRYPLYVELHGLWEVADNPIDYLTWPYLQPPLSSVAFEDGYSITPWGRGNHWYKNISETDIWECISEIESLLKIDSTRKYLWGFSMGGFGTWSIGRKSLETWAALGLYSPSLWYNRRELMKKEVINKFKNTPTYFITGTKDGNKRKTKKVYRKLGRSGNDSIKISIFKGGHVLHESEIEKMNCWMKQFKK